MALLSHGSHGAFHKALPEPNPGWDPLFSPSHPKSKGVNQNIFLCISHCRCDLLMTTLKDDITKSECEQEALVIGFWFSSQPEDSCVCETEGSLPDVSFSMLQEGMPQTLTSTSMFTPCSFSPHLHTAKEDEQGGLIFQDGNLTSASLDALIQHLIPTTDYYPEVSHSQYNKQFIFDELGLRFMQKCKCLQF